MAIGAFFQKTQSLNGCRRQQLSAAFERFADEADLHAAYGADGRGGQERPAGSICPDHVRGQVLEAGGFGFLIIAATFLAQTTAGDSC